MLLAQAGCAVNPVTGKKEIMLVSQSMEINMGKQIDRGIRMEYGLYNDPQLTAYVADIGEKLVPYTHRPNLDYHFAVLDTPVENAFAAPGGYIYVTRGLLALMNSEAELASVLGHELGHVSARHSAKQITRSIIFSVGIIIANELSEDFRKIAPLTWIAGQLLFLKYSRGAEHQSDELGIGYAIKAGYASEKMIDFFNSLQRITSNRGGSSIPNFLSTHPVTTKRIDRVREQLRNEDYPPAAQLAVARGNYLKRINGIVYGKNPRQGYVENGVFYHPDMSFSFRVPYSWKVENTARQVTMAPANGKAVIILQAETTSESLDNYTQRKMKDITSPRIIDQGFRQVNGLNAFHTLAGMVSSAATDEKEAEELNIDISCIRKGETVFTFFSAADSRDYYAYENAIGRAVNSFRPLRGPRHLKRRPRRLYIRRVTRSQTLGDYLQRLRIPQKQWKTIAMVNGIDLNHRLSANQAVKIIK
jgi:predicted Zn-dependent protease